MRRTLLVLLLFLATRNGFASGALLLERHGSLLRLGDDGTSQALVISYPFGKGGTDDACYSTVTQTLYCIDLDDRIYRVHPLANGPEYEQLNTGFSAGGLLLDGTSGRPVTCRPDNDGRDHPVVWAGAGWDEYAGNTPLFDRVHLFSPYLLANGCLSKSQLLASCPYTSVCLKSYPDQSEWVTLGRSTRYEVRGLIVADAIPVGQPYPLVLLVDSAVGTTASLVTVPEYGDVWVFGNNIVVRARVAIRTVEGGAPEQFTGNYYVYDFPSLVRRKYALGTDYDVLGASKSRLYLGKGNCVYVQPIGAAQGAMSLSATLDSGFEPFKVFPLEGN